MKTLKSGDIAPKFILPDQDNQLVNLIDFLGKKVLIYFYPKAMTPGCTIQACNLRDHIDHFTQSNVEILGISIDLSDKLLRFSEQEMLDFTLLSDKDHLVSNSFGVWGEKKFMGKKYYGIHRTTFLVDEYGRIDKVFNNVKVNTHHLMVLKYIK